MASRLLQDVQIWTIPEGPATCIQKHHPTVSYDNLCSFTNLQPALKINALHRKTELRWNSQNSKQHSKSLCYIGDVALQRKSLYHNKHQVGAACLQASGLEDHWAVREEAARLAALVCRKYGEPYYQIQPRITQALNTAFQQTTNPLTTHYGKQHPFSMSILTPRF